MIIKEGEVMKTQHGLVRITMVSYDGKKFRPYGEVLSIRHDNVVNGRCRKKPIQAITAAAAKA